MAFPKGTRRQVKLDIQRFAVGLLGCTQGFGSPSTCTGVLYELQPIFPTEFNGHGFLIWGYTTDYTKLQEGPLCLVLRDVDSGAYKREMDFGSDC